MSEKYIIPVLQNLQSKTIQRHSKKLIGHNYLKHLILLIKLLLHNMGLLERNDNRDKAQHSVIRVQSITS